ncbi:golgin subfamily A member 1 isoform X2 [Hermetia illucens]|uniref:golgin subfamily A member 1 isoform X2 n=1 Tax=Hermetia illucens TaxID=343691 RepID=UPI0018CC04AC|nr:golgin subfamily A member 1 isoform X2 [Hermetia illucens]
MFTSLKNKIKEETGNEVPALPARLPSSSGSRYSRGRLSSAASIASLDDWEQKETEINNLRVQCNELTSKHCELSARLEKLEEEKSRLEKTNEILLESVRVAQTQKDLICAEQESIQNIQQAEIAKLKSLLSFREQEAVDRLAVIKTNQQQIDNLRTELERLKPIEPMAEDLKDELERFRHSAQLEKNNLTTTLAAVEEENRHLKSRLQIVDQSRLEIVASLNSDEKVQALAQERKLLEQHLEEAHLQLSDIKSSWSGQNLALETQLSRLSKQVAEETTEKRKAIKARDEMSEKVKQLEFDLAKWKEEVQQRDNKIALLEDEIDELTSALRECRLENEEEESQNEEILDLKNRLNAADERFNEFVEKSEQVTQALRKQNTSLQEQLQNITNAFETEKQEKLTALLRNAEISQSEEILKKELRIERNEVTELLDKVEELEKALRTKDDEILVLNSKLEELSAAISSQSDQIAHVNDLHTQLNEKNKSIKVLNQRLADLKKTLQNEIKSSNFSETNVLMAGSVIGSEKAIHNEIRSNGNSTGGSIIMDEVNFKYLKHVIVKFLTSREVEARHLIRAVATLLHLNTEEEKLLHDTLTWKMSWFGTKPDHGHGQRAFSIPPS